MKRVSQQTSLKAVLKETFPTHEFELIRKPYKDIALEIIIDDKVGLFFDNNDTEEIVRVVRGSIDDLDTKSK